MKPKMEKVLFGMGAVLTERLDKIEGFLYRNLK
jgi:hypothetical protein